MAGDRVHAINVNTSASKSGGSSPAASTVRRDSICACLVAGLAGRMTFLHAVRPKAQKISIPTVPQQRREGLYSGGRAVTARRTRRRRAQQG